MALPLGHEQNGKVCFLIQKQLVKDHIPLMFIKTMDHYVLPTLAQCDITIVTFNLWMLRMGFDTFAIVVNFLNKKWVLCHVMIGLFEAPDIGGIALVEIVKPLSAKFELTSKVIITCVKDKGKNVATLNSSLLNVFLCGVFQLERPYLGVCFGHVMSKVCQYAIDEDVVCQGMKEISLKKA